MILDRFSSNAKSILIPLKESYSCGFLLNALKKRGLSSHALSEFGDIRLEARKRVRASVLISEAFSQAQDTKVPYVGTEHILLSLLKVTNDPSYIPVKEKILEIASYPPVNFWGGQGSEALLLESLGKDLTNAPPKKALIRRQKEMDEVWQVLLRKSRHHPILFGEEGVGKTTLVEQMALDITSLRAPQNFWGSRVFYVNVPTLFSSFATRGDLESSLGEIFEEAYSAASIIVLDGVSGLSRVGVLGASYLYQAVSEYMNRLNAGGMRIIALYDGAQLDDFGMEEDLFSLFTPVKIPQMDLQSCLEVLKIHARDLGRYHGVSFPTQTIKLAAELSYNHLFSSKKLPGSAIDLLDEAAAYIRFKERAEDTGSDAAKFSAILEELEDAIARGDMELAVNLRNSKHILLSKLKARNENTAPIEIGPDLFVDFASSKIGIPKWKLHHRAGSAAFDLEERLGQRIVGQPQALSVLSESVRRGISGVSSKDRPWGAFLFLGPTGVGKTETAKVLSDCLYGSRKNLIRFDMSEFREPHMVARLIGAPPGYVGFGEGGELTGRVSENPHCVILFDEVEKAHGEVLNILLQIMEEGELTDGQGRVVSFRDAILILTSNAGTSELARRQAGFETGEPASYQEIKDTILNNIKSTFRVELLNRFTEVVVFKPLEKEDILRISNLELTGVADRLKKAGIAMELTAGVSKYFAQKGFSREYGARPIRRLIEKELEEPIAKLLLKNPDLKAIKASVSGDKIIVS